MFAREKELRCDGQERCATGVTFQWMASVATEELVCDTGHLYERMTNDRSMKWTDDDLQTRLESKVPWISLVLIVVDQSGF